MIILTWLSIGGRLDVSTPFNEFALVHFNISKNIYNINTFKASQSLIVVLYAASEVVAELLNWLAAELRRVLEWGEQNREPWASFLARGDGKEVLADTIWIQKHF